MGITRICKATHRNLMVNITGGFTTHLTFASRQLASQHLCPSPTQATSIPSPPSPARVIRLPCIFRLPFSHTEIIAKGLFAVEVGSRASNRLPAPIARLSRSIRTTWVWPTTLAFLSAIPRAILLIEFARTLARLPAYQARWFNGLSSHISSITDYTQKSRLIEIEEKYCEIAAKRMSQLVFPIEEKAQIHEGTGLPQLTFIDMQPEGGV